MNTSVIVGKIYGKDIRDHGSKSAGLTNTLRVLGKPAAALVLAGDVLKGVIACSIGLLFGVYFQTETASDCVSLLAAGAAAVIGHNWPVFFKFKGGKGALTGISVMFMADWRIGLAAILIFAVVVAVTRYVSLGTLCACVIGIILSLVPYFAHTLYFYIFAVVMVTSVVFRHRTNIVRLVSGTENKLSAAKK
jgi:glycerol-3-phosphate acyltransferase PlsY